MTTRAVDALLRAAVLSAALLLTALLPAAAEDDPNAPQLPRPNFAYKTVKTKEGLVFQVPADMPIEMRDGIQAPIPFDEYIYSKFSYLEARLSKMDERMTRIENKLDRLSPMAGVAGMSEAVGAPSGAKTDSGGILKAGVE